MVTWKGNREVAAEELIAYETGYRNQISKDLNWDISLFYFDYDDLGSIEPGAPYVGALCTRTNSLGVMGGYFKSTLVVAAQRGRPPANVVEFRDGMRKKV